MSSVFNNIRTAVFYFFLSFWTVTFPTLMLLVIWFIPFRYRHQALVGTWSRVAIALCRVICGIRWKVYGMDNIPNQPCVIISNHQSTWETFFLQTIVSPQTQVLKKELLSIPFFGWVLRTTKPIAIDRKDPRAAMQRVRKLGLKSLANQVSVLIFPEGTRNPHGKLGKFSRGGASLACTSGVGVLPVAHNAGQFWPHKSWVKKPGTIEVFIGEAIKTDGKGPAEVNNEAREWIENILSKAG